MTRSFAFPIGWLTPVADLALVPAAGWLATRGLQAPGWLSWLAGAWLFVLLARQQGLDAVLLALDDPNDPLHRRVQPWAVGVLSENDLYLFDPAVGVMTN